MCVGISRTVADAVNVFAVVLILVFPALVYMFLHFLDYYFTVEVYVSGRGYELDEWARSLMDSGSFDALELSKVFVVLTGWFLYLAGLLLLYFGATYEHELMKDVGSAMIIVFFVMLVHILMVVAFNVIQIVEGL